MIIVIEYTKHSKATLGSTICVYTLYQILIYVLIQLNII